MNVSNVVSRDSSTVPRRKTLKRSAEEELQRQRKHFFTRYKGDRVAIDGYIATLKPHMTRYEKAGQHHVGIRPVDCGHCYLELHDKETLGKLDGFDVKLNVLPSLRKPTETVKLLNFDADKPLKKKFIQEDAEWVDDFQPEAQPPIPDNELESEKKLRVMRLETLMLRAIVALYGPRATILVTNTDFDCSGVVGGEAEKYFCRRFGLSKDRLEHVVIQICDDQ